MTDKDKVEVPEHEERLRAVVTPGPAIRKEEALKVVAGWVERWRQEREP